MSKGKKYMNILI